MNIFWNDVRSNENNEKWILRSLFEIFSFHWFLFDWFFLFDNSEKEQKGMKEEKEKWKEGEIEENKGEFEGMLGEKSCSGKVIGCEKMKKWKRKRKKREEVGKQRRTWKK